MSFAENVESKAIPVREAILAHPFIMGIGDGSLPIDRFKHYIEQDYAYLIDYSRVLAVASARAPTLDTMGWFANLLDETLNTEMELHRSYCAEFGITKDRLEAVRPAPTTIAYTSFLLKTAHQDSFGELVASLVPCQWGYWEIGDYLARNGEPQEAPLYCQWIQMYASKEFAELAQEIRILADQVAEDAGPSQMATMEQAYLTSLRFEYQFWEMSYTLDHWTI